MEMDFDKHFEYENKFYLTAGVERIGKFSSHLELFRRTSNLPGEVIECGVFKGASLSRFIKFRSLFENPYSRKIIAFDIFGEFPKALYKGDAEKRMKFIKDAGNKGISKDSLISILKRLNLYQNVELVEGNILKTVSDFKKKNQHLKISLLHIDVDLYEATKVCLEEFCPLVVKGGIVILDDYGKFAGANKAIDEFFANLNVKIQKLPYSFGVSFVEVASEKL